MTRGPAPAKLEANESSKTTDEVKNSPRMVSPGSLACGIDGAAWSAVLKPHHSNANLQRSFAVYRNFAHDVSVALTMRKACAAPGVTQEVKIRERR